MSERDEIEQVIAEMRERSREFAGQVGGCQCETSWHSDEIDGWAERLSSAMLRRSRAVLSPGGAAEKDTPMRFRKKPVVIEAQQFRADKCPLPFARDGVMLFTADIGWHVETLEGPLRVSDGDWIIKGVKGEFYPCKPDVFAATYESADTAGAARPAE